jgi:enoyl-CoA hydratase
LGNCLSVTNCARLVIGLGAARTKRILLLSEMLTAEELLGAGFLVAMPQAADLDAGVAEICDRLVRNAPVTMRVSKEAIRRLLHAGLPDGDDLIRECYGSEDFRAGVQAFVDKREAQWSGR